MRQVLGQGELALLALFLALTFAAVVAALVADYKRR
jgi:hypothetical protein